MRARTRQRAHTVHAVGHVPACHAAARPCAPYVERSPRSPAVTERDAGRIAPPPTPEIRRAAHAACLRSSPPVLTSHGTHDETRAAGPTRTRYISAHDTPESHARNPIPRLHIEASGHASSRASTEPRRDTCHAGYNRGLMAPASSTQHEYPQSRHTHATSSDDIRARADSTHCETWLQLKSWRGGAPDAATPPFRSHRHT